MRLNPRAPKINPHSGNFNTGTSTVNTPTLTITQDIVLNITVSQNARYLAFDEWVVSPDANQTSVAATPTSQSLSVVNNATVASRPIIGLFDNGSNFGGVTNNDGLLQFSDTTVANGTSFTIKAGSYTFASSVNFNPALNGTTFTGNVFLVAPAGTRLSDFTTVPEPSAALLSLLGAGFLLLRRKR